LKNKKKMGEFKKKKKERREMGKKESLSSLFI
jgi:hypothetical protein